MIKKCLACMMGILMLTGLWGNFVQAHETDFPEADETGKITIHSFDVSSFDNLKMSHGSQLDEDNLPDDASKQAGIVFSVQRLDDRSVNAVSVDTPIDQSFKLRMGKTNNDGELVMADLPKGYYLIKEVRSLNVTPQKSPFIVMLPMRINNPDGSVEWNYDVHVYPKHNYDIQITKQVASPEAVVGVGDEVLWSIDYEVGREIKKETADGPVYAKDFFITDTMDSRLTYQEASAVFRLYDREGHETEIVLKPGLDYTEVYDREANTVTWTYTDQGVRTLADQEIGITTVTITTVINPTAVGTVAVVWNNAAIDYINANGDPYHLEVFDQDSDKNGVNVPKVYLGSIAIDKYEQNHPDQKLAGVAFKAAGSVQDAEAGEFIQIEGNDYEVITNKQGQAEFTALGSGEYWLVEVSTASGYTLLDEPIKVTIGAEPSTSNIKISVANEKIKKPGSQERKEGSLPESESKEPDPKSSGAKEPEGKEAVKTGDRNSTYILFEVLVITGLTFMSLWKKKGRSGKAAGNTDDRRA